MFATGLIVFRETLEAALFVGIVAAATRTLAGRSAWLGAGVAAGVIGALALATAMGQVSAWADGLGQEVVNAVVISLALLMLSWHCVWVSTHAHEMVANAKQLASDTVNGSGTLWALSVAVALSVLREGAETVLFVAGLISGSQESRASLLMGAASGLFAGVLVGWGIYSGLARIQSHKLFAVTQVLVLLLAGSLASQLARIVSQAGWLSMGAEPLWDGSAWLSNDSAVGTVLHALVGYDARPSGLQLASYVVVVAGIAWASHLMQRRLVRQRATRST